MGRKSSQRKLGCRVFLGGDAGRLELRTGLFFSLEGNGDA
jgi:hypothetical protein